MALVSEECLNEWKVKNSWVYINFAYMFSNKVWKLRVPSGFSACPYFWIAIFSMCIFKPALEPFLLGAGWLIKTILKLGGKPFVWWDKFIYKKIGGSSDLPDKPGMGLVITFLLFLLFLMVMAAIGGVCWFYMMLYKTGPEWAALFWYTIINFTCIIITSTYITKNKHREDRCKVEWYSLLCFIITTITLYWLYPSMVAKGLTIIWEIIVFLFTGLFAILCVAVRYIGMAVKVSFVFLMKYGWIALKYTGKFLVVFIIALIPFLIGACILGCLGLIIMKLVDKMLVVKAVEVNKIKKTTPEEWKNLLYYSFSERHWLQQIEDTGIFPDRNYKHYSFSNTRYKTLCSSISKKIMRCIVDGMIIPNELLNIPYTDFEKIRSSAYHSFTFSNWKNTRSVWQCLTECLDEMGNKTVGDLIYSLKSKINSSLYNYEIVSLIFKDKFESEYNEEVDKINKDLSEIIKENEERKKRAIEIKKKHDELCKKVSSPIAIFFTSMFKGIGFILSLIFVRFIWKIIMIKSWKGICFTARQVKIFFVYMWVVLKHLKHGACPYLQFVDPPPETIKKD